MFKFFEQIGFRPETNKTPEKNGLMSADIIKTLDQEVVMSHNLALINHEAPREIKELAMAQVRNSGYTEAVPWQGFKSQLFCKLSDLEQLAKAQEIGLSVMTLKKAAVSEELLSLLVRPENLQGYSYDEAHNLKLLAEKKPYIVFDKID